MHKGPTTAARHTTTTDKIAAAGGSPVKNAPPFKVNYFFISIYSRDARENGFSNDVATIVWSGTGDVNCVDNRNVPSQAVATTTGDFFKVDFTFRDVDSNLHEGQYEGFMKDGEPCYGRFEDPTKRFIYQGGWLDSKFHGYGEIEITHANGDQEKYSGGWMGGTKHGYGKLKITRADRAEKTYNGGWKGGKRCGYGEVRKPGLGTYVGGMKDDKAQGHGMFSFSCGETYVGGMKDGKIHGHGQRSYADGRKYVGGKKDGKMHGHGEFSFASGVKYVGGWKDDKMHGHGEISVNNVDTYVGGMKDNKMYGHAECSYVGGMKDGKRNGYGVYSIPGLVNYEGVGRRTRGMDSWIMKYELVLVRPSTSISRPMGLQDIDGLQLSKLYTRSRGLKDGKNHGYGKYSRTQGYNNERY
eukprot:jgi/Botrbrau1/9590/Bobra.106_2s0013.1